MLGLYNVSLVVYGTNPSASRAYERASCKRIGVRRGAHRVGRCFDIVPIDAVADGFALSPLEALVHPRDATQGNDVTAEVQVELLSRKDRNDA